MVTSRLIEAYFLNNTQDKFQWIGAGCTFNPYVLISIVSGNTAPLRALLYPFDVATWIALILIMLFTVVFLRVSRKEGVYTNLRNSIFFAVSILFQQTSVSNLNRYIYEKKNPYKAYIKEANPVIFRKPFEQIIVAAWMWTAFLTSNLYKGDITAAITSPRIPAHPQSIQDLQNFTDFPVYTSTKHMNRNGTVAGSTLKELVLTEVIEGAPAETFYRQLNSRITFLNASIPKIVASLLLNSAMPSEGNKNVKFEDSELPTVL